MDELEPRTIYSKREQISPTCKKIPCWTDVICPPFYHMWDFMSTKSHAGTQLFINVKAVLLRLPCVLVALMISNYSAAIQICEQNYQTSIRRDKSVFKLAQIMSGNVFVWSTLRQIWVLAAGALVGEGEDQGGENPKAGHGKEKN